MVTPQGQTAEKQYKSKSHSQLVNSKESPHINNTKRTFLADDVDVGLINAMYTPPRSVCAHVIHGGLRAHPSRGLSCRGLLPTLGVPRAFVLLFPAPAFLQHVSGHQPVPGGWGRRRKGEPIRVHRGLLGTPGERFPGEVRQARPVVMGTCASLSPQQASQSPELTPEPP